MRKLISGAIALSLLLSANLTLTASAEDELTASADRSPIDLLQEVGALSAWPYSTGAGVTVAVLDGGVGLYHPDLADRAAANTREATGLQGFDDDGNGFVDDILGWDFIDGDGMPWLFPGDPAAGNGFDDDGDGRTDGGVSHGSYAAGLIAGRTMGVAPRATILPVRVVDDEGTGSPLALASGIDYARQRGASVIYVGVGLPEEDELVRAAVKRATAAGALVIAPAGNSTGVLFPAAYDETVAVTTGDVDAAPPDYGDGWAKVDIAAPGQRLYAPRIAALTAEPGYARVSGTSYSAALVAGAAALVRSAAPSLSANATASVLIAGAEPQADGGPARLDAGGAVRLALGR
jgi:subtilisin family serine protease